ncbi:hypothetical protein EPYR_02350 [Erwinia pyrifoliae DSM 12163]|nr:hypothetical protein EPYR_02350 [Erwinia pyrifoliae DSM 12163]
MLKTIKLHNDICFNSLTNQSLKVTVAGKACKKSEK